MSTFANPGPSTDRGHRLGRLALAVLTGAGLALAACAPPGPAAPTAAPPKAAPPTQAPAAAPTGPPQAAKPGPAEQGSSPKPAAPATGPPAAKPQEAAGPAPRRGGTAVVAVDADPETLNIAISTGNAPGDVGSKIFEGLVWLDQENAPQPALATSWTVAPDGKSYTFKLRQGVKWHDGRDFSSADVKFSMEEVLAKFHPRSQVTLRRLEAVEAPDPLTVTITLKEPYAPFLLQQTAFDMPIIPKHLYEGSDVPNNPANQRPVGTGPFKFGEWNRGSNLRVVRNEGYWDAGKPHLDAIVFQIVPQGANRSTGLETGEIDFVLDFYLPKADVPRLLANDTLQAKRGQGNPAIDFMMMNLGTPALATKEARQALAFAINRETQVQQAMGGLGRPGFGAFGDGFKWLLNEEVSYPRKYPHDVEKGKAALAAAGVGGAPTATLRLVYDAARPQFVAGAQIIRDNLRQIGLNVDLQPLERSVMIQKVYTEKEFDLTLQSFTSSGDPSIGYHRLYLTNSTNAQFANATGYSNPRVDELLGKAATTPIREDRAAAYRELQVILNEDLPTLILFDEEGIEFATKKLNGVWQGRDSRDRWGEVWLTP